MANNNNKHSSFVSHVDVLKGEFRNADAAMPKPDDVKSNGDPIPSPDQSDKRWELLTALDQLPPVNLPRLSGLSFGFVQDGSEACGTTNTSKKSGPEMAKLCGFLSKYKLGARGWTKVFKRRWFVFADSTCNLLYYRTPQDLIPLGEIDISHATFTFDLQSEKGPYVFEIMVNKKTYWLEAEDKNTMLYWLQELQFRRKQFRARKTSQGSEETPNHMQGLLDFGVGSFQRESSPGSADSQESGLMDNVSMPQKTVGPSAASAHVGRTTIKDVSIANLGVELRNAISGFKHNRQSKLSNSNSPGSSQSSFEEAAMTTTMTSEKPVTSPTNLQSKTKFPGVSEKISILKNKIVRQKATTSVIPEVANRTAEVEVNKKTVCGRCRQLEEYLKNGQTDMSLTSEELTTTREMLKITEKEKEKLQKDVELGKSLSAKKDTEEVEEYLKDILNQRNSTVVELEYVIEDLSEQYRHANSQCRTQEVELQGLKEDVAMYQENIAMKDEVVVNLTRRVADLEGTVELRPCQRDSSTNTIATTNVVDATSGDANKIHALEDRCEAFQLQNKFLNQEILELNNLLQNEETRGDKYQVQLTQVEAQFYELKSKYIYMLQELSKPQLVFSESGNKQELLTRLLHEVLDSDRSSTCKRTSSNSSLDAASQQSFPVAPYDQYGFNLQFTIECDDLGSMATSLRQRSEQLKSRRLTSDTSNPMRWDKFLISISDRPAQRSNELKLLLRDGLSPQFRGQVWKMCIELTTGRFRAGCGSEYYKNLLERVSHSTTISPIMHQVQLDLLRTLPNNRYYECYESDGIPRLKNILLAFAFHNPSVGYCQGLNRLAAILLLFLDEEDSFWGLVSIIEMLMPSRYYDHTLIAAHADQRVLKDILSEKLPNVSNHFVVLGFDVSLFTFNWFLAIFIDNIPVETYLRIWDSFLYEGSKVLFRYTLAILKFCEDTILSKKESADLHAYMRSMGDVLTDVNRLSQIAFNGLNPFPMKMIEAKRQLHMQKLIVELEELNRLREQYQNTLSSRHSEMEDVSEEEEEQEF